MQLLYFHGKTPNFGDELNWYIFEGLFNFNDFAYQFSSHHLMGIGSILHDAYFSQLTEADTAVLFGAGTRTACLPTIRASLDKFFVRGPISANIYDCEYITDAAYLLIFLHEFKELIGAKKKAKLALMPYFHHIHQIDWGRISIETGIRIIMPNWPPHKILKSIAESYSFISGAMHGCIVADILRIPWTRLRLARHEDNDETQNIKWMDWLFSIKMTHEAKIAIATPNSPKKEANVALEDELIRRLKIFSVDPALTLSHDSVYGEVKNRLMEKIHSFSAKYDIGINTVRVLL